MFSDWAAAIPKNLACTLTCNVTINNSQVGKPNSVIVFGSTAASYKGPAEGVLCVNTVFHQHTISKKTSFGYFHTVCAAPLSGTFMNADSIIVLVSFTVASFNGSNLFASSTSECCAPCGTSSLRSRAIGRDVADSELMRSCACASACARYIVHALLCAWVPRFLQKQYSGSNSHEMT